MKEIEHRSKYTSSLCDARGFEVKIFLQRRVAQRQAAAAAAAGPACIINICPTCNAAPELVL